MCLTIEIRRANAADAEGVADILLAARTEMAYLPMVHGDGETRAWIRDVLLASCEVWVAEVEGRVAGFAALGALLLEQLYVRPVMQGRGIGALLLERAKERRPAGLRLWVFQRNEGARRFYEQNGFVLVELTDGAGNEEREPDTLYEWQPTATLRR